MSARTMPAIALTLALAAACEDQPVAPADRPPPAPAEGLTEAESVALFRGIARVSFDADNPIHPGQSRDPVPAGRRAGTDRDHRGVPGGRRRPGDERGLHRDTEPVQADDRGLPVQRGRQPEPPHPHGCRDRRVGVREYVNVTGTITGDLKWQLWQRSGTCPIAGTLDGWASVVRDPDEEPGTVRFTGSVCGHEVKIDMSEWMPPLPT